MALSFTREYKRIIEELAEGILKIPGFYDLFEMREEDWKELSQDEQFECARTLADDVFYALGKEPSMTIAEANVEYERKKGIIQIKMADEVLSKIDL